MTIFFRFVDQDDKDAALRRCVNLNSDPAIFVVDLARFSTIPTSPFAYWLPDSVLSTFQRCSSAKEHGLDAMVGAATTDDYRFIRASWEIGSQRILENPHEQAKPKWVPFAKGGQFGKYYSDIHLVLDWSLDGRCLKTAISDYRGARGWGYQWSANLNGYDWYFRPGITWPRRSDRLSFRILAKDCIFGNKGPAVFTRTNDTSDLLAVAAILNSKPFNYLVSVQLARTELACSYEVGLIQQTPIPDLHSSDTLILATLARRAWSLSRSVDSINETSRSFLLPLLIRSSIGTFDVPAIDQELTTIHANIDDYALRLYGLSGEGRSEIERWTSKAGTRSEVDIERSADAVDNAIEADDDADTQSAGDRDRLLSWCVGVLFGRFDLRLATGERPAPAEPEPFDPFPARSSGMMPDDSAIRPILTDDDGHSEDLSAGVRSVLSRVNVAEPGNLRAWLARDFFPLHIRMYSKSRRKAPIYWQLATASAGYSIWLYIHAFTKDTFYKVQNDYAAPKLEHEFRRLENLRRELGETPRPADRKILAAQETFVEELSAFLEEVKRITPLWNPDLDDGVLINFAPLHRLVPHHKPWQKELKATWDSLSAGEYDWAHLAMHLWPERVVPKCATDRSLAIAHGLEDAFWLEDAAGKWKPRQTPQTPVDDLVRARTSPAVKAALASLRDAPTAQGTSKPARRKGAR